MSNGLYIHWCSYTQAFNLPTVGWIKFFFQNKSTNCHFRSLSFSWPSLSLQEVSYPDNVKVLGHPGLGSLGSGDQRRLDFWLFKANCLSITGLTIILDTETLKTLCFHGTSYKLFQVRSWCWLAKCVTFEWGWRVLKREMTQHNASLS